MTSHPVQGVDLEAPAELARRLRRVFISDVETGYAPPDETLLRFARDILAADFTDPDYGPRAGDGGPAMALVPAVPARAESEPGLREHSCPQCRRWASRHATELRKRAALAATKEQT